MIRLAALVESLFGKFGTSDIANAFWGMAFDWADKNRASLRVSVRKTAGEIHKRSVTDDEADDIADHIIYYILERIDVSNPMANSLKQKLENLGPRDDKEDIILEFVKSYLNEDRLSTLWDRNEIEGYLDREKHPVLRQVSSMITNLKKMESNQMKKFASILKHN